METKKVPPTTEYIGRTKPPTTPPPILSKEYIETPTWYILGIIWCVLCIGFALGVKYGS